MKVRKQAVDQTLEVVRLDGVRTAPSEGDPRDSGRFRQQRSDQLDLMVQCSQIGLEPQAAA